MASLSDTTTPLLLLLHNGDQRRTLMRKLLPLSLQLVSYLI